MKRDRIKGFASGVAVTLLCVGLIGYAFAAYQKQATLDYMGINITLNGSAVTPKDANGNYVEPFAIDGTIYLPVRGIASATGLDVAWDQTTQTVALSSAGQDSAAGPTTESGTVVYNEGGIKITYTGNSKGASSYVVHEFDFLIENNTDKRVSFSTKDLSVNGYMVTAASNPLLWASGTITPGDKYKCTVSIQKSDLDENSIESISAIKFFMQFNDADKYATICTTPLITVSP